MFYYALPSLVAKDAAIDRVPDLIQPPELRILRVEAAIDATKLVRSSPQGRQQGFQYGTIADVTQIPKVYVIGDLHGMHENLLEIFAKTNALQELREGKAGLMFLGDLTHPDDKSMNMSDSIRMLDYYLELKIQFPDCVFLSLGNHDFHSNDIPAELKNAATEKKIRQGGEFLRQVRELFGEDSAKAEAYLSRLDTLMCMQPLGAVGTGAVMTHAGPSKNLTRAQIINASVEDRCVLQQHEAVRQLGWTRDKRFPSLIPQSGCSYDAADVTAFLETMDVPNGVLLSGHTRPKDGPEYWCMHLAPNHAVLTAAASGAGLGYAVLENGKVTYHTIRGKGEMSFIAPPTIA